MNKFKSSVGPNLKIIGICYYAIVLKEEKKKQNYTPPITFCENAFYSTKQNISYVIISVSMLILKIMELIGTSQ